MTKAPNVTQVANAQIQVSMVVAELDYKDNEKLKTIIPGIRINDTWASFEMPLADVAQIRQLCDQAKKELGITAFSFNVAIEHAYKQLRAEKDKLPLIHGAIVIPGPIGEKFRTKFFLGDPETHFEDGYEAPTLVRSVPLQGKTISLRFKNSVQVVTLSVVNLREKEEGRWVPLVIVRGTTYRVVTEKGMIVRVDAINQIQSRYVAGFPNITFPGRNEIRKDFFSLVKTLQPSYAETDSTDDVGLEGHAGPEVSEAEEAAAEAVAAESK